MENIKWIVGLFAVLLLTAGAFSQEQEQEEEQHVFVAVTYHALMPDGGSEAERDSLLEAYHKAVTQKNDKILSQRVLHHYYGSNSNEWIVISECKSWADIEAALKLNGELFRQTWADEKQREEFNQALGKYFKDWHSDEIYHESKQLRK